MKSNFDRFVKYLTSDPRVGLAASAAALSVGSLFVPYGYPWPSLAWATLACAITVWVGATSSDAPRPIFDVIRDVDAELPAGVAAKRGVGPGRTGS